MEQKSEIKKNKISLLVWILIILVVIALILYWGKQNRISKIQTLPTPPPSPIQPSVPEKRGETQALKEDSVSAINQDLDKIETLDLSEQFKEIDTDLNSL
jgi:cytoskeletal protein RodZ